MLPEFRMCNIPVSPNCRALLEKIIPTHKFNPICAFEYGTNRLILPIEYGPKLRGAIAEVRFTLSHKIIKKPKKGPTSYFRAMIDEIFILGAASETDLQPSRARHRNRFYLNPPNPQVPIANNTEDANPGNATAGPSSIANSAGSTTTPGLDAPGPSTVGPSAADPSAADPSAADPSAAGPSAAGPSAAGPSAAGHSRAHNATDPDPNPRASKRTRK
jgi:hypothetical protein